MTDTVHVAYCPVCQGPANIIVVQISETVSTHTCEKHPQFSHTLTLPKEPLTLL